MSAMKELFDRWAMDWHRQQDELIPACMAATCIGHDRVGDGAVTPEAYAAKIAAGQKACPDTRYGAYGRTASQYGVELRMPR